MPAHKCVATLFLLLLIQCLTLTLSKVLPDHLFRLQSCLGACRDHHMPMRHQASRNYVDAAVLDTILRVDDV
jgi:hypothetical protein